MLTSLLSVQVLYKAFAVFSSSLGAVGRQRLPLAVQGGCGCMLHYFEHVLIVIHRVTGRDSSELCGERTCSVSWVGWLPRKLHACPKVTRQFN